LKQKRNYSLTAKERKAKRMAAENKAARKSQAAVGKNPAPVTRESAERAMVQSQKQARTTAIAVGAVCALAILLILVALIAPVIMYIVNPYRGYKSVIARFNLSNGMKLEFVIEEDKYDTAATNFIFLATNGFFDNTVFYDAQNGWLRFGGYEAQPATNSQGDYGRTHHRRDSEAYCRGFKALANSQFTGDNRKITDKFRYRLRADSTGTNDRILEQEGVLAFLYSDTATEFQFSYMQQATNLIDSLESNGSHKTYELNPTMVGHALNANTVNNLKKIASSNPTLNPAITSGYLWRPPTPDIKIESVKVYNLNGAKWRDFNFIEYAKGNDSSGNRRLSSWQSVL